MPQEQSEAVVARLFRISAEAEGVFRGRMAGDLGVSSTQLRRLQVQGIIERLHPDTYRMTVVPSSETQRLRAALLWAGDQSAAGGLSAAAVYGLEGIRAVVPEIALPHAVRGRTSEIVVQHGDRAALMVRRVRGFPVTGIECTLVRLAYRVDGEAFEVACEDARRRRLTTVPAMHAYLERFGRRGRPGVAPMRKLLGELDPQHPARSTLEVLTRRLLVANGINDFVREFPLDWNGRTYRFDFGFPRRHVILETNGRRWHDDPTDYEHDNEKWSVPARHGYRIVFATWDKVTQRPEDLLGEVAATLAA